MTDQHIDDLIDVYALGALETEEQIAVEEHLDRCSVCRVKADEARQIMQLLAWTPDQFDPPSALRGKVIRRVKQLQQREGKARFSWREQLDPRRWIVPPQRAMLWGTALAFALVLLGLNTLRLQREVRTLRAQAEEQAAITAVLSAPDVRVVSLVQNDQNRGYLLLNPHGDRAYLSTTALAALPNNQTYQFWLIADGQAESAGIFRTDERGRASLVIDAARPLSQYQAVGISVEPAGGSQQPTTDPIVVTPLQS